MPAAFVRTVSDVHGEAGRVWLAGLGDLVAELASRWQLEIGERFELSYNYVTAVTTSGGTPAVVKLGVPSDAELAGEAEALRLFGGEGAVRLLRHDADRGALLLERADPGVPCSSLVPHDDDAATVAVASVLWRLWRSAPPDCLLRPLEELAGTFDRYWRNAGRNTERDADAPLDERSVRRAETLFADLVAAGAERVVLHGDLHHDNVLSARREPWLAIDAKGLTGPRGYDAVALLYNPWGFMDATAAVGPIVDHRVDVLAGELDLDVAELRAWGYVKAMLTALWGLEDHGRPHPMPLRVAAHLASRLG